MNVSNWARAISQVEKMHLITLRGCQPLRVPTGIWGFWRCLFFSLNNYNGNPPLKLFYVSSNRVSQNLALSSVIQRAELLAASSMKNSIWYNMIIQINLFSYIINSFDREYICCLFVAQCSKDLVSCGAFFSKNLINCKSPRNGNC